MMKPKSIDDLVNEAIKYIIDSSYSKVSQYHYGWVWSKLKNYAREQQQEFYTTALGNEFIQTWLGSITSPFDVSNLRAMKVLDDIYNQKPVRKKYPVSQVNIPTPFYEQYKMYKESLKSRGQKPRSLETKLSRLLVFLRYLEEAKLELLSLNFDAFEQFNYFLATRYNINTQANIKFTVRDFLITGEQSGFIAPKTSAMLGAIYSNKHERLPSTYTKDETQRILLSVDRNNAIGKRDYAMLILLIELGMRASDINHLSIQAIQPEDHTLTFIQQKTGKPEKLPLTPLIELALADYLKNVRPKMPTNRMFIVHKGANQGRDYSDSTLNLILNKYIKRAGIKTEGKRHGTHSMRHSLSSNLLKDGVELPVISGILGHSNSEITMRYFWMNTELLRKLSLEVPCENN